MASSPPPPAAEQMDLGFITTYDVIPTGRPDVFHVRLHSAPRLGGKLLTPSQAGQQLGLCRRTIYRLCDRGLLPAHKPGIAQWRILQRDLDAYKRAKGIPLS